MGVGTAYHGGIKSQLSPGGIDMPCTDTDGRRDGRRRTATYGLIEASRVATARSFELLRQCGGYQAGKDTQGSLYRTGKREKERRGGGVTVGGGRIYSARSRDVGWCCPPLI
ncbi:hypothetical protein NL676_000544 [Syzygium grande]|nr:hypothetical protein NL676_000544 [Syzygium grande]